MKKDIILKLFVLATMSMSLFMSCEGGDDVAQIIDGVNVSSGRKLTKLSIIEKSIDSHNEYNHDYVITYDSHKRIINVNVTYGSTQIDVNIDYEQNLITTSTYYRDDYDYPVHSHHYRFYTNDKGLISRCINYYFLYDNRGTLKDVRGIDNYTLYYSGDDLMGFIRMLEDQEIQYDWYEYGTTNSNERYISVEKNKQIYHHPTLNFDPIDGLFLIALQSGALGNQPLILRTLSQRKQTTIHVTTPDERRWYDYDLIFTYE